MSNRVKSNLSKEIKRFSRDYAKVIPIIYNLSWKLKVLFALRLFIKRLR